jgi:hypothetical protein
MTITAALKNFIGRIASQPDAQTPEPVPTTAANAQSAVVVPLRPKNELPSGSGLSPSPDASTPTDHANATIHALEDDLDRALNQQKPQSPPSIKFNGVLDTPELKSYLDQNFFGFGRHTGANYQTKQALDTGRQAVISNFVNVLEQIAEKHHAKRDVLERSQHDVSDLSPELSSRLELSLRQNDRLIQVLERQMAAARSGDGWITAALREYESGFTRGVHDAINFDRIEI